MSLLTQIYETEDGSLRRKARLASVSSQIVEVIHIYNDCETRQGSISIVYNYVAIDFTVSNMNALFGIAYLTPF
ncbi:hypothetical protein BDV25DRAFT_153831 [Aspergillus avenaceus]|uniref:Uncharacterized protein n=1 Tax=Aspergillus avenaceus TaxID=36643 RepID=A0A5N6TWJ9_ASPAV|nr:hypothetical protein BDV25DRAFT_153831 [Aspergillus avenaceus]